MMGILPMDYWLAMLATAAFAASAVLVVFDRDIDLFGAFVLGIVTAIGGGTVRDLILDIPVFWSIEQSYIWVALFASILTYVWNGFFRKQTIRALILYLDAFGAALFGVLATGIVWELKFCLPIAPVMLGVLTAIGGGLLRDVLAGRKTLLMSRELYAIPVMLGCIFYLIALFYFPNYQLASEVVCILLSFGFRVMAIYWKISVPYWFTRKSLSL